MDFLTQLRDKIADKIAQRTAKAAELDQVLAAPAAEARDMTAEENARFTELRDSIKAIDSELDTLTARRDVLVAEAERRESLAQTMAALGQPVTETGGTVVRADEAIYRPDGDRSWLVDAYRASGIGGFPSSAAAERIARNNAITLGAERRDATSSAFDGAIPPKYLLDKFAPVARAGRPFCNAIGSTPLGPDGISFTVPRGTTGTSGAMTDEAAAFSETDYDVTDLTNSVRLVTGQQDISRTVFMRGNSVVDQILFPDLIAAAETALNLSVLNGSGTAPQHRGVMQVASINAVTYTDGSPTVAEAWPKLADAIQRINSNRYAPATLIVMHPRRWGWVTSALDSQNRPLFNFQMEVPAWAATAFGEAAKYGQVVGTLQGLPVVTDASIPTNLGAGTNEDIVLVVRHFDVHLFEDSLFQLTFEQAIGPEKVRLAVGKFSLLIAGRYPSAISTVGGSGLVTPTF